MDSLIGTIVLALILLIAGGAFSRKKPRDAFEVRNRANLLALATVFLIFAIIILFCVLTSR